MSCTEFDTHFNACDCREEYFKKIEKKLADATEALEWINNEASKGDCWKNGENGVSVLTLKEVAHAYLEKYK